MILRTEDITGMFDLSCVRMYNTKNDIIQLIQSAREYSCSQISVFQCFIDLCRELLKEEKEIKVIGNVSFPSGSDNTELKVIQAKQLAGKCDEIDMVMNVNWLISDMFEEVERDVLAVKQAVGKVPLKVIIESSLLSERYIKEACEICISAGAAFVKTGTGWTKPTKVEQVRYIKSVVGDRIAIKASGGVENLNMLIKMYKSGATRFGVNLKTGLSIIEECNAIGGAVKI